MLRVADRIKKWGTMATGMLDRSKGGMLSTAGKLAAGGALLTLGIGALHVAQAKARADFNAGAASLIKELREEIEKAKELQKTLNSRCEELGAKPCGIDPSAAAVDQRGESAGFKRALESVQERVRDLDRDVNLLRNEALDREPQVRELKDDLTKLRLNHSAQLSDISQRVGDLSSRDERAQQNQENAAAFEGEMRATLSTLSTTITKVASSARVWRKEAIANVAAIEAKLNDAMDTEVRNIDSANRERESRLLGQISEMETRVNQFVEASDRRSDGNLATAQAVLAEMRDLDHVNDTRIKELEKLVRELEKALDAPREHSFGSSARLLPTMLSALGAVSSGGREKIAAKIVDVLVAQAALHRSADPRVNALYTE
jgi:hypothetical protein